MLQYSPPHSICSKCFPFCMIHNSHRRKKVVVVVVVVNLGFTTLSTSQVISVAFYSELEKSDKFCTEALISTWGSFMCRKSTTQDPRPYFPSEGSHTQDFYALKPSTLAGFEPANLRSSGEYDNHWTTGVDVRKYHSHACSWCFLRTMWIMYHTEWTTSQVISVAFYSELERSDKFCSEALISAWVSFMCRKSTTRDPQPYFPSAGSHTYDFYVLKNHRLI